MKIRERKKKTTLVDLDTEKVCKMQIVKTCGHVFQVPMLKSETRYDITAIKIYNENQGKLQQQ